MKKKGFFIMFNQLNNPYFNLKNSFFILLFMTTAGTLWAAADDWSMFKTNAVRSSVNSIDVLCSKSSR